MQTNNHKDFDIYNTLQELYQQNSLVYNFVPDYTRINSVMALYEKMEVFDKTLLLLYDHKNMRIVYASKNIEKIIGYTSAEIRQLGMRFYFKVFHSSHLGFPFRQVRIESKLYKIVGTRPMLDRKVYLGGLKLLHKNGTLLRGFFKVKPLVVNEHNLPELSIIQGEDFSHFFKGAGYWIRVAYENFSYCYVSNSSKKEFKDLISPRELDVIKLIAQNKSTTEISERLHLSVGTINSHRKNMIARSGAVNTTALVHLCKLADII